MALQSSLDTSARETHSLIGSDKVQGTSVFRSNGEKVGSIDRVMIDKISGKVSYAVMSFGGFMGIGEDYYLRIPTIATTYSDGSRPPVPIDRDHVARVLTAPLDDGVMSVS